MSRADDLRATKERRTYREVCDAIQIARRYGIGRGPCPKWFQKSPVRPLSAEESRHGQG